MTFRPRTHVDRAMLNPVVRGWAGLGSIRNPFWRGFCRGWLLTQPAWLVVTGYVLARWAGWL